MGWYETEDTNPEKRSEVVFNTSGCEKESVGRERHLVRRASNIFAM